MKKIIEDNPVLALIIVYLFLFILILVPKILYDTFPEIVFGFLGSYLGAILGSVVTIVGIICPIIIDKKKSEAALIKSKIPNVYISLKYIEKMSDSSMKLNITFISGGPGIALNVVLMYSIGYNDDLSKGEFERLRIGSLLPNSTYSTDVICNNDIFNENLILSFADTSNNIYNRFLITDFDICRNYSINDSIFVQHSEALLDTVYPSILICMFENKNIHLGAAKIRHAFLEYGIPAKIIDVKDYEIHFQIFSDYPKKILNNIFLECIGETIHDYEIVEGDAELF